MLTPDTVYALNQRFLTFRLPRTSFKKFLVACVFKKPINRLSSNLESTFYPNNTITTRVYDYFVAWRGFADHRLRTAAANYIVATRLNYLTCPYELRESLRTRLRTVRNPAWNWLGERSSLENRRSVAGCQGRATFGTQTARWPAGGPLRARWQINCEPCADGLIHLSCRYKRLSRSNFILRFWLSHPDSFEPDRSLSFSFTQLAIVLSILLYTVKTMSTVLSLFVVRRRVLAYVPCPVKIAGRTSENRISNFT